MPTLELLIDASGMQRGAQQAEASLRTVTAAAEGAAKAVDSVYGNGTSIGGRSAALGTTRGGSLLLGGTGGGAGASQVLGGSIQSAAGIAQTAQALGQLNIQAAAFGAARSAFEIGNTIDDFTRFRAGIGGATTAMSALGLAFKANPFGIIAAGIGIAATAMALFSSKTEEANSKLSQFRERNRDISANVALGATDTRNADDNIRRAIIELRAGGRDRIPAGEAAGFFGVSEPFLRGGLQDFGINQEALSRDTIRRDNLGRALPPEEFRIGGIGPQAPDFTQRAFSSSELAQFGEQLLREQRGRSAESTGNLEAAGFRAAEMQAEFSAREREEQARQEASRKAQEEAAQRIEQSMERAAQFGEQIGASVGDAAAQMLFAGRSFRDVISNLVRQFATQGLQNAGAGIFRAAVQGITATQSQGNQGVDPGQLAPNE